MCRTCYAKRYRNDKSPEANKVLKLSIHHMLPGAGFTDSTAYIGIHPQTMYDELVALLQIMAVDMSFNDDPNLSIIPKSITMDFPAISRDVNAKSWSKLRDLDIARAAHLHFYCEVSRSPNCQRSKIPPRYAPSTQSNDSSTVVGDPDSWTQQVDLEIANQSARRQPKHLTLTLQHAKQNTVGKLIPLVENIERMPFQPDLAFDALILYLKTRAAEWALKNDPRPSRISGSIFLKHGGSYEDAMPLDEKKWDRMRRFSSFHRSHLCFRFQTLKVPVDEKKGKGGSKIAEKMEKFFGKVKKI